MSSKPMPGDAGTIEKSRSPSNLEDLVPADYPLQRIRRMTDVCLDALHDWLHLTFFPEDTHWIEPEKLVRAILLQVMYSIPSDRQLVDRIWHSKLLREFIGIEDAEPDWNPDIYAKLRQQMLDHEIVREAISRILAAVDKNQLVLADATMMDRPRTVRVGVIPTSLSGRWRVVHLQSRARPELNGGEVVEERSAPSCRLATSSFRP